MYMQHVPVHPSWRVRSVVLAVYICVIVRRPFAHSQNKMGGSITERHMTKGDHTTVRGYFSLTPSLLVSSCSSRCNRTVYRFDSDGAQALGPRPLGTYLWESQRGKKQAGRRTVAEPLPCLISPPATPCPPSALLEGSTAGDVIHSPVRSLAFPFVAVSNHEFRHRKWAIEASQNHWANNRTDRIFGASLNVRRKILRNYPTDHRSKSYQCRTGGRGSNALREFQECRDTAYCAVHRYLHTCGTYAARSYYDPTGQFCRTSKLCRLPTPEEQPVPKRAWASR